MIHYWWRVRFGLGTYAKGDYWRYVRPVFLGYWLPQQIQYPHDASKWEVCAIHFSISLPWLRPDPVFGKYNSKGQKLKRNLSLAFKYG